MLSELNIVTMRRLQTPYRISCSLLRKNLIDDIILNSANDARNQCCWDVFKEWGGQGGEEKRAETP